MINSINVLVTGATGFVGSALLNHLSNNEKFNIFAVTRNSNIFLGDKCSMVHVSDINRSTDWSSALINIDVVVHLAARAHVMKEYLDDPIDAYRKMNADATHNLAKQASISGVKRFIFLSSIKVNGEETSADSIFTETVSTPPTDPYGLSKYEAENYLRKIADKSAMEVVIIRPPLIYGPGVKANFRAMMKWLYKGIPLPFGAIHNKRSLISIDNLTDFICTTLTHPSAANQTFLVSDDNDLSTTQLLTLLARSLKKPAILLPIPMGLLTGFFKIIGRGAMAKRLCGSLQVDISKAKNVLNWRPPKTTENSLEKTARYFLNEKNM